MFYVPVFIYSFSCRFADLFGTLDRNLKRKRSQHITAYLVRSNLPAAIMMLMNGKGEKEMVGINEVHTGKRGQSLDL